MGTVFRFAAERGEVPFRRVNPHKGRTNLQRVRFEKDVPALVEKRATPFRSLNELNRFTNYTVVLHGRVPLHR